MESNHLDNGFAGRHSPGEYRAFVPQEGLEPPPSCFGSRHPVRWATGACVRRDGFEPPMSRGRRGYSPLHYRSATDAWGALPDSNRSILGSQPSPSATWVKAPVLGEGVEPSASRVWAGRSIHLS
jgi:hypothetical protein